VVQTTALKLAGTGTVAQVNTEENPLLARRFAISGIPAMHLLVEGRSVAFRSGTCDPDSLIAWFRSHLPPRDNP
jgi:thioredoxin-like negative regulator of GroEL